MTFPSPLSGIFIEDERVSELEVAGPRRWLAFEPARVRAGILVAGGVCPGTNNVIRGLVLELWHRYGVREVVGFRYGFEGLCDGDDLAPVALTPDDVRHAHRLGGSMLGTSRERRDGHALVDAIARHRLDALFVIGGNGTLRAAHEACLEIVARRMHSVVVAIPKTIDDDIAIVDKTFGFDTAVEHARRAIDAAHAEATSGHNGVCVVKLMGRDAGFVAAHATIASAEANFCLLPEYAFELYGERGLLPALEARVRQRGHAVIVIAEGCGQRLATPEAERDPAGNLRYASASLDIGPWLCERVKRHFADARLPLVLKYIDPSYTIRAAPANASDAFYCATLARHAVHAAMAGRTDMLVGRNHGAYVHVPLAMAIGRLPQVGGDVWQCVLEVTGQRLFA